MSSPLIIQYVVRFLIVLALSIAAVFIVSEIGIRLQSENIAREPTEIELLIPAGTAARVAAGEDAPTIPDEMTFVEGDVLVVVNEDTEAHTLGPLYIPSQGSASMRLDHADNYALACSFSSAKYLGLNVKPPTTLSTRLTGISFAAPPTAVMLFIYSLIVFPIKPADGSKGAIAAGRTGS